MNECKLHNAISFFLFSCTHRRSLLASFSSCTNHAIQLKIICKCFIGIQLTPIFRRWKSQIVAVQNVR